MYVSAKQRAGRAGRTGPGKCYRLYTEHAFKQVGRSGRRVCVCACVQIYMYMWFVLSVVCVFLVCTV